MNTCQPNRSATRNWRQRESRGFFVNRMHAWQRVPHVCHQTAVQSNSTVVQLNTRVLLVLRVVYRTSEEKNARRKTFTYHCRCSGSRCRCYSCLCQPNRRIDTTAADGRTDNDLWRGQSSVKVASVGVSTNHNARICNTQTGTGSVRACVYRFATAVTSAVIILFVPLLR